MTVVIGTDEAGYGPNLGPLVVAATAWRIDSKPEAIDEPLAAAGRAASAAAGGLLWGDSKRIYRGSNGLAALERGVLTGLLIAGEPLPADWPALVAALGAISPPDDCCQPDWAALAAVSLPRAADAEHCLAIAARIGSTVHSEGVALESIACRAIYPGEFNALLDAGLNKSDILSQTTLSLAAALRGRYADEPAVIWCDRHGGRKSYAALVSRHFDTPLVQPLEETPARSVYCVPTADAMIAFRVGGESRLPVALASMTAKYVRELAMHAFNAFWSERVPGLTATAGYPVDANRWRAAAGHAVRAAGIADDGLWRRS
jgi:ribonuclease HII